jgi:flagellar hook-basal body complex protein FliE
MDIQASFATQLYDRASRLSSLRPDAEQPGPSFSDTLAQAARDVAETVRRGEAVATQAVSGTGDVQSVVEALTATELALQTAVTVRDRVVEAYQEVLRMPV